MNAVWSWVAQRLSPFLKPLLLELLEQDQSTRIESAQTALKQDKAILRKQLIEEVYSELAPQLQAQLSAQVADQVHDILNTKIRVWGDRDRLHIAPTAGAVNTLFNTASGHITLGEYTFTGHNVSLLTGTHDIQKKGVARMTGHPSEGRDIIIGKGVWICSNATVLGPCTIGDNAVVAAGAVVLSGTTVPAGAIVAGVPARVVQMIEFEA